MSGSAAPLQFPRPRRSTAKHTKTPGTAAWAGTTVPAHESRYLSATNCGRTSPRFARRCAKAAGDLIEFEAGCRPLELPRLRRSAAKHTKTPGTAASRGFSLYEIPARSQGKASAGMTQHFSKMVATPWPPPMHSVARPFLASSRFCISWSRVTMIRAPEAPTG